MDPSTLSNALSYCAQIAVVTAAAAALPALLRMRAAHVRYAYWRGVLALCLLLPWVQGRLTVGAGRGAIPAVPLGLSGATRTLTAAGPDAIASAPFNWLTVVLLVLAGGMVLRLLWIAAGLFHLRRLRTIGTPASAAADEELQWTLGTHADIRSVPGLTQPVTFGVIRPVVLIPDALNAQPAEVQRAVLAHELLHVQRRDWLWILAEELVRAAFWFHPAMWWLISRVQLAREEAVDELAVLATGQRRTYVEALLAFADSTPLAPAPAFARRRHLLRRIQLLAMEGNMSSTRVAVSAVVMAVAVIAGTRYAVGAFPLQAASVGQAQTAPPSGPGAVERRAQPVTPENPIPRRIASVDPIYPDAAVAAGARGAVHLWVTIDEFGRVAEARSTHVSVSTLGQPNAFSVSLNADNLKGPRSLEGQATGQPGPEAVTLARGFVEASIAAVTAWQYDPPARGPISFAAVFTFQPPRDVKSAQLTTAPPPPPPPPPPQARDTRVIDGVTYTRVPTPGTSSASNISDGAIRIGGEMKPPKKTRHVAPVYPPIAQSARVQGIVIIEARIEADGRVGQARVLKSIPLLDQAALDAVQQWEFEPTFMNGQPTPVMITLTVNFTLEG